MTVAKLPLVGADEYIARERAGDTKHELLRGVIIAMAGASPRHNAIAANVIGLLHGLLRGGPCSVLTSDQRVYIEETDLYTYPDVTVVCGKPLFHAKCLDTLLNPRVIVEVLSDSTADYERGPKFAHYRRLASFEEYLCISQLEKRVEHSRRIETGQWLLTEHKGDDAVVVLTALGCELRLADIYENADRFG
ncbi:MAG: Uma2 family endonuclease [Polyangiaceae bacterium]|nr:Uma2 family endonuclease [Polyangiaceae bacterium]